MRHFVAEIRLQTSRYVAGLTHSKNVEILLNGLFSIFMIGIDVLVSHMEMANDGGKEMVIGGDIHDDCHVILNAI